MEFTTSTSTATTAINDFGLIPTTINQMRTDQVSVVTATTTPLIHLGTGHTSTTTTPQSSDQSSIPSDMPSSRQVEDLNFYLRRLTIGGSGDIAHIESYGGGADYEMFLDAVNSIGIHHGWTEAQIIRTVEMKLKDKAREYYGALLPMERPKSMTEMREWFRRVFGRRLTISAGKRELDRCIRNPGEPLGEYAQRLKVIANKMFPATSLTSAEKRYHRNLRLVNQFIEGLDGRLANEILRSGEFYCLEDCLRVAEECEGIVSRMVSETRYDVRMSGIRRIETHIEERRYESNDNGSRRNWTPPRQNSQDQERLNRTTVPTRETGPRENGARRSGGYGRNYPSGSMRQAGSRRSDFVEKFPYMRNRCYRCGEEGHFKPDCAAMTRKLFCFHCGKVGEICSLNSKRPRNRHPN